MAGIFHQIIFSEEALRNAHLICYRYIPHLNNNTAAKTEYENVSLFSAKKKHMISMISLINRSQSMTGQ
jgi:hypothetical protein